MTTMYLLYLVLTPFKETEWTQVKDQTENMHKRCKLYFYENQNTTNYCGMEQKLQ